MMPRTVTIDAEPDDRPYEKMLERMARQNRVLYGNALLERERWLGRHLLEAQEQTRKFIEQIGGFDALARITRNNQASERIAQMQRAFDMLNIVERYEKWLLLLEQSFPGYSDLMTLIDCEDVDESKEARVASRRLANHFGLKLKNPRTKRTFSAIAKRERGDYAQIIRERYLPRAIRTVISDADRLQVIRLGTKWEKSKGEVVPKIPRNLPFHKFYRWFKKEVYRELGENVDALDLARSSVTKRGTRNAAVEFDVDLLDEFANQHDDELPAGPSDAEVDLLNIIENAALTDRQREILTLGLFSKPTVEVARAARIVKSTVRGHKKTITTILRKIH